MTRVYLIRHAEAEGNLYRRIHGWYDSLITETGRLQVEALRRRFEKIPLDAVYSSDLIRTRTTAEAVYLPKGLRLVPRRELREIGMGEWEDRTWGSVAREEKEELDDFNFAPERWRVAGSEPFLKMRERVTGEILRIGAAHPGQTVAVVSHGTAIRAALSALHGLPAEQVEHSDNTAVSLVELEGGRANVVFENDNSHLSPELSTFARQEWWRAEKGAPAEANLWFRPLDLEREGPMYMEFRREAWKLIHGTEAGFNAKAYWIEARELAAVFPEAISCAMLGDRVAGMIQLDDRGERDPRTGGIPFYYMAPEYRSLGMGVQLMGQAVSVFRPMGKTRLRLRVAAGNVGAIGFYERYGFHRCGSEPGVLGELYVMEKEIGRPLPPL